jgi:mono/diheme cytochrome c family protein
MNLRLNLRKHTVMLIGVALLTVLGVAPFAGSAQEASPSPVSDQLATGQKIFANVCIACHQPGGAGIPGIYPALNGNPLVTADDPTYLITTVLNGRGGMPTFRGTYDDEEVAAIATYIRQSWDNNASPVTAAQVKKIRDETAAPSSGSSLATPEGQIPRGNLPSTPALPVPTVEASPSN